ncbi:MAG: cobalamin-independent methionine synthase II family protein [candidate division NC10 bacterium]|nr:cobalamin-independent methionine synthase II family protein [candidate division NC10 bacterium]
MADARWPILPVTVVGSWPRPRWLSDALKARQAGTLSHKEFTRLADEATLLAIKYQEDAGVDIISDGEQRRDNFYSFVIEKLEGVTLMSLMELLEFVEDKAAFEHLLGALDVPAFAIKNPTVTGKLSQRAPLVLEDYQFLQAHTRRPVKVTLPGPYLLSRSMWVRDVSDTPYPRLTDLAEDVIGLLRRELLALRDAGADVVQFDEPVLTEVVFAGKAATRTFMCAALAARESPEAELAFAVEALNRVVDGIEGPRLAIHICRGNWSQREDVLLAGTYDPLLPHLFQMKVDQYVLEFATPRAGGLACLARFPPDKELGLGACNPRSEAHETAEEIAGRIQEAVRHLGPERVFVNPDCGFGTFAERPVSTTEGAYGKLQALATAAHAVRASLGR